MLANNMLEHRWRLLTAVILVTALGCAPPMRLQHRNHCVVADVQELGEYYTIVSEIALREKRTGNIIWTAQARKGARPHVQEFTLCAGRNQLNANLRGNADLFEFQGNKIDDSFYLNSGELYVVEVESPNNMRRAKREFVLEREQKQ